MRSCRDVVVCVSALAVLSAPAIKVAVAAPTISCTRAIDFGTILPSCNGSITVLATPGSGTVNNGCHSLVTGVIRPALCNVQTTLGTAASDVRITFAPASRQFARDGGGGLVTLDNYVLETASGSQAASHTYAASLVDPTHVFRVGGRLRFDGAEPVGSYSSGINVVVTAIP